MRHEAPRRIPTTDGRNSKGTFLGPMTDLDPKGVGGTSPVRKLGIVLRRRGNAPGDPRDMAKARLPESQSPADAILHPPETACNRRRALRWPGCGVTASFGVRSDVQ